MYVVSSLLSRRCTTSITFENSGSFIDFYRQSLRRAKPTIVELESSYLTTLFTYVNTTSDLISTVPMAETEVCQKALLACPFVNFAANETHFSVLLLSHLFIPTRSIF